MYFFFFSSRRRHTRSYGDWSSDVCSSDLDHDLRGARRPGAPDGGVDLLRVEPAALVVHRFAAADLLPPNDPRAPLHVADHVHLHSATTSPTISSRLFATGTVANSSTSCPRRGRKAASAGPSGRC